MIDWVVPISHNFHGTITKKLQQCTDLKEELSRIWQLNMDCITLQGVPLKTGQLEHQNQASGPVVNGILGIGTTHNEYYSKQITQKFKTAYSPPCCIYSNAESSNTQYVPFS